jgi:hypothetical protein
MALVLVDTAGSAGANTYCSVESANAYFETRLHKDIWANAGAGDKGAALVWATRLLDEQVRWKGFQAFEDGALRWPRSFVFDPEDNELDHDAIPQWLKNATAEYAMHLLAADRTLETNRDFTGFKSVQVDVIKIAVNTYDTNAAKPVLPQSVWSMVKFYGSYYGRTKTLVRQ